jgi:sensor histidine kinase YesM
MNKILKSLLIALFVTVCLHLVSFLVLEMSNQFDKQEINDSLKVIPISFSLFFFPIFSSFFFFNKNKTTFINILKSGVISVLIVGLFEVIYFGLIISRQNFKYFDAVLYRVIFIGFFISFFCTIFKLKTNINQKVKRKSIQFSWKIILLIPVIGAFIYSIIILVTTHYTNAIMVWLRLFPFGLLLSIISIHFFNKKFWISKKYNTLLFYILSIVIVILLSLFTQVLSEMEYRKFSSILIRMIIPSIVIYSPYYLFVVSLVHLYYLNSVNKKDKLFLTQQSLETQLNYQKLKNQISPHFLFNNINVLTSLIEENPKKAVQFSENLSHIYRYFLEQEKQDVVLVKDEIEFAKSYLDLLKDRFEGGFAFLINIDKEVKEKYIVTTILQQVLENVVKHNEVSSSHPIEVTISSVKNSIIVKNNKNPKLTTLKTSQKGIENMKNRIAFFTDEKIVINDLVDSYTIQLPILESI